MFHAYFEEAQMALLNFFVLFFLPNAHHFPSLFRFAKKWRGSQTSIGRMVLGESLESCSIQCSTVSFIYCKNNRYSQLSNICLADSTAPSLFIAINSIMRAFPEKKNPKLFAFFSHIIYRTKLPYA